MRQPTGHADAVQQNSVLQYKNRQLSAKLAATENQLNAALQVVGALVVRAGGVVEVNAEALAEEYEFTRDFNNETMRLIIRAEIIEREPNES